MRYCDQHWHWVCRETSGNKLCAVPSEQQRLAAHLGEAVTLYSCSIRKCFHGAASFPEKSHIIWNEFQFESEVKTCENKTKSRFHSLSTHEENQLKSFVSVEQQILNALRAEMYQLSVYNWKPLCPNLGSGSIMFSASLPILFWTQVLRSFFKLAYLVWRTNWRSLWPHKTFFTQERLTLIVTFHTVSDGADWWGDYTWNSKGQGPKKVQHYNSQRAQLGLQRFASAYMYQLVHLLHAYISHYIGVCADMCRQDWCVDGV